MLVWSESLKVLIVFCSGFIKITYTNAQVVSTHLHCQTKRKLKSNWRNQKLKTFAACRCEWIPEGADRLLQWVYKNHIHKRAGRKYLLTYIVRLKESSKVIGAIKSSRHLPHAGVSESLKVLIVFCSGFIKITYTHALVVSTYSLT